MARRIRYKDGKWVGDPEGFQLYVVEFIDDNGKIYEWCPKWETVEEIFESALSVEEVNGGKAWVGMAETALQILTWLVDNFKLREISLELPPMDAVMKDIKEHGKSTTK